MPKLNILNVSQHTGTEDSRDISLSIKDIPIGEIFIKENVRKEYEGIDDLKASIRQYGLLQPITVYKEDGNYNVKTGHRRFLAFKSLYNEVPDKFHSIRCIVSDASNIAVIQLVENVQRVDLSQFDLYNALVSLKERGLSLKQIADIMGKSEKYIKNIFTAVNEINKDDDLKNYINPADGSPAGGTMQDIAETAGIQDKDELHELLKQRKEGNITRAELREKAKELKSTGTPENWYSPAGGTIQPASRETDKSYTVRVTANKEQRHITIAFDDDTPYEFVYKDLKKIFDKRRLVVEQAEGQD
jgi:ParB family chromosome partitioning protein